jgi:serine/threonine-protein kinase PknK
MTPRMLEMSYGLEPDRGGVDYLAAGYVRGAKSKRRRATSALREILDAGHDDSVELATPAVGRAINNERIRLRCTIGGSARPIAQGHSASRRDRHDSAELVDESAVRLLVASGWADDREQAWRATQLLAGMDARRDRWRRCALNCCWLKFVPAQEDLLIQLPLP